MNTIDRYLLRQFLNTFTICFSSLMGLYFVFDLFTNLEEFIRCGERVSGGIFPLICHYYGYRSIVFFDRTSALFALTASMFTVTWIQRHNELTALMAAGISRVRVIRPIIAASILLAILAMANRELLIPRLIQELSQLPNDLLGDHAQNLSPRTDGQSEVLIQGRATYANEMRIEQPDFLLPDHIRTEEITLYGKHVVADNAYYRASQKGRPGGYLMSGVTGPRRSTASLR